MLGIQTMQQLSSTGGAFLCAGICSIQDVRKGKIPNIVVLPAIMAGLMVHGAFGGWRGLGDAAAAGMIAGAISVIFWIAGGMGAGDVKLMASVGCIAGLSPLPLVAIAISIAAGAFAIAVSVYYGRLRETLCNVKAILQHHGRQGLRPHPDLNLTNPATLRLPFAVPVAAGCLFALCTLAWEAYS